MTIKDLHLDPSTKVLVSFDNGDKCFVGLAGEMPFSYNNLVVAYVVPNGVMEETYIRV